MSGPKLIAELGMDGRGYEATLNSMARKTESFAKHVSGTIGAAVAGAFTVEAGKRIIDYGSKVHDTAQKIGVGTKSLQEMKYAAEQNGASVDDIARAFKDLAKSREEALGGDAEKMDTFKLLGIDENALRSNPIEQTFRQIAKTVRETDFGANEEPMMDRILGRSGTTLLPMFKDGLAELSAEANRLGIVMEEKVINNLDKIGDSIDKITAMTRGGLVSGFAGVATAVGWLLDKLGKGYQVVGAMSALLSLFNKYTLRGQAMPPEQLAAMLAEVKKTAGQLIGTIPEDAEPKAAEAGRAKADGSVYTGGVKAEADETARVLRLREEIYAIMRKAEGLGMTDAQKKSRIRDEVDALKAQIGVMDLFQKLPFLNQTFKESDRLGRLKELAGRGEELAGMEQNNFTPVSDSLSQIGGFTGASGESQAAPAKESAALLKEIRSMLRAGSGKIQIQDNG